MKRRQALMASMVRLMFLTHGMISVFAAVYTTQIAQYWFIGITSVLSMLEITLTYRLNESGEWKWFIPSVFIYLMAVIPVVWILEISMLEFRLNLRTQLGTTMCVTVLNLADYACYSDGRNTTEEPFVLSEHDMNVYNFRADVSTTLQQTLMLVLIIGRWLLPKGQLTRDQLSQLLLVYIGMAADMLEFSSETLRLQKIGCSITIFYVILAVWTWSLMQFTLGLTATKARKRRVTARVYRSEEEEFNKKRYKYSKKVSVFCCGTELWALMTSVIIQDGPYLIVRLYLIFGLSIFDQSTIFFTCKNGLLLVLQFYRLVVVLTETSKAHEKSLRIRSSRSQPAGGEDTEEATGAELNSISAVAIAAVSGNAVPSDHAVLITNHTTAGELELATHTIGGDDVIQPPPNGVVADELNNRHRMSNGSPRDGGSSNLKVKREGNDLATHSHHNVAFALDDD